MAAIPTSGAKSERWPNVSLEEAGIELPVLDMALLDKGPEGEAELAELASKAMEDGKTGAGFMFLINHGVPLEKIEAMFEATRRYHDLPFELKMKGVLKDAPAHWGYIPPQGAGSGRFERKEENAAPTGKANFRGSASFFFNFANRGDGKAQATRGVPKEGGYVESGLKEVAEEYYALVDAMARRLLPVLALGLGLPRDYLNPAFEKSVLSASANHYPDAPNHVMGAGPHTDGSFLTFLGQPFDVKPGIELCLPDGRWLSPPSMPGAMLVHGSDLLRRWTNHKWVSTPHRVVNPPGQDRYSIPCFWSPWASYQMEAALPGCEDSGPGYASSSVAEFMRGWALGEYTTITTLKPAQVAALQQGFGEDHGIRTGAYAQVEKSKL